MQVFLSNCTSYIYVKSIYLNVHKIIFLVYIQVYLKWRTISVTYPAAKSKDWQIE